MLSSDKATYQCNLKDSQNTFPFVLVHISLAFRTHCISYSTLMEQINLRLTEKDWHRITITAISVTNFAAHYSGYNPLIKCFLKRVRLLGREHLLDSADDRASQGWFVLSQPFSNLVSSETDCAALLDRERFYWTGMFSRTACSINWRGGFLHGTLFLNWSPFSTRSVLEMEDVMNYALANGGLDIYDCDESISRRRCRSRGIEQAHSLGINSQGTRAGTGCGSRRRAGSKSSKGFPLDTDSLSIRIPFWKSRQNARILQAHRCRSKEIELKRTVPFKRQCTKGFGGHQS